MLCQEILSYRQTIAAALLTAAAKLLAAAPTVTAYTLGASLLSAGELGSLSTNEWPDKLSTAATALILFGVANDVSDSIFGKLVQLSGTRSRQTGRRPGAATNLLQVTAVEGDVRGTELTSSSYGSTY